MHRSGKKEKASKKTIKSYLYICVTLSLLLFGCCCLGTLFEIAINPSGTSGPTIPRERFEEGFGEGLHSCSSATFSPDGNRILTVSKGTIELRNAHDGSLEEVLIDKHIPNFTHAEFSPDGKLIISSSLENDLEIWDGTTGELLRTLVGHEDRVWTVSFSKDGKRIFSGSQDQTVRIWNTNTGELLHSLKAYNEVHRLAISFDGLRVACPTLNGEAIGIWDVETGEFLKKIEQPGQHLSCIAFSSNGDRIASGESNNRLKIWNSRSGDELNSLPLYGSHAHLGDVAFSPDERHIIASDTVNNCINVWDVKTGDKIQRLFGPSRKVAFDTTGNRFVASEPAGAFGSRSGFKVYKIQAEEAASGKQDK